MDKLLVFSDNQDVHATDAAVNSTNDIDCGIANANLGAGEKKTVYVDVGATKATGGTSVKATLYESEDDSTYTVLLDSVAIAVATLVAGYRMAEFVLPARHKRYLRVVYTCVGAVSAITADAYIAKAA